jgi:hypothetical protein
VKKIYNKNKYGRRLSRAEKTRNKKEKKSCSNSIESEGPPVIDNNLKTSLFVVASGQEKKDPFAEPVIVLKLRDKY